MLRHALPLKYKGKMFSIWYEFTTKFRHDKWNAGDGASVSIPIEIYPLPDPKQVKVFEPSSHPNTANTDLGKQQQINQNP
jgi:hypothetical protein